jgi:predicted metal-binding membrane protein
MRIAKFLELQHAQLSLRSRAPVLWPWILVIAAWTVALLAVLTKHTYLLNHSYLLTQSHFVWIVALGVFLAGFQVMIFDMMVPSSMPLFYIVAYTSRRQQRPWMMQGAFLLGYALIWTAFALGAFVADTCVHWLVSQWFWLYLHSWLISATIFALAGGFQFSSLKEHCLKQNRSRLRFFTRHYPKGTGAFLDLGLRHGMLCLGGCWALMLVMFGIGTGSLLWMAVLTGVMVIEKTYPGGQRLSLLFGTLLLVLAAFWLVHPAWLLAGSGI